MNQQGIFKRRQFLQKLGTGVIGSLLALPALGQAQSSSPTLQKNKAISRRFAQRIAARDIEGAFSLIGPGFVNHTADPGGPPDKEFFIMLLTAFPDLRITILDLVAEGDKVVRFSRLEGTNSKAFMGAPATRKKATWLLIDIDRIVNGKIVEHWDVSDNLGMMQQLGLIRSR